MPTCTYCGLAPKNGKLPRGLCQSCVVALIVAGTIEQHRGPFTFSIEPGTQKIGREGYVTVMTSQGAMSEHRAVMIVKLGRALVQHENVHHINGMRADNRPENLELWSTSQPAGQRVEDKLAWAKEFIDQYDHISH